MNRFFACFVPAMFLSVASLAQSQNAPALPYSPSLDVTSMDKSIDPCVDFYQYSCGGWQKRNPIPADQTSWSVYSKLYQDNLTFLRGILEDAAAAKGNRNQVTQEIGDFYGSCMNEAVVNRRGVEAIQGQLNAIAALQSVRDIAPLVAKVTLPFGQTLLFGAGSTQDPDNSEAQIADLTQGGLGLPDRDYYTNDSAKSKEIREKYVQHLENVFELLGDAPNAAQKNAQTVMRMETALAKASWTRVEERNPYNLKDKVDMAGVEQLAPRFDWPVFFRAADYPRFEIVNVESPKFFKGVNDLLGSEPLDNWKTYLRFHVANSYAPFLSDAFANENFGFYRGYLRGAKEQEPRWQRCVRHTDYNLGEALGQAYVAKVFSPELKAQAVDMVNRIEAAMRQRIDQLDWMSPETKRQALVKLEGIRNKIGYPDKWRDYSSIKLTPDDFAGNMERTGAFELHRQIGKVGKPVDHGEWLISAATVDAYYDPQMNDINFPAGVLQPPVYDARMDDAPNYGDTGGTIGHELTHGFDDEGSQFDAKGNLKNWWTKEDREKFDARTKCVDDQYSSYVAVDDVHLNGKLTLGENVADLGGEILALQAWQTKVQAMDLQPVDGLTPEQRFFVGFAQWDCAIERPDDLRERVTTDPHSPARFRINGVVVNMPEFGKAFGCKAGQPMVRPADQVCRVW
ncbi:MAG: M13 family metallopeptidase [Terracidiphilus sp.]